MRIKPYNFLISFFSLCGCIKPPDIPKIPYIEFKEIYKINTSDSLINKYRIVFYFRDGDGDIGIRREEQNQFPFNLGPNGSDTTFNPYHKNLWVTMQLKRNGNFIDVKFNIPDNKEYNFYGLNQSIIPLNEKALQQKRPIEGVINFDFEVTIADITFFKPNFLPNRDTVRFKLILVDRAFNKSNEIYTTPIHVVTPRANVF